MEEQKETKDVDELKIIKAFSNKKTTYLRLTVKNNAKQILFEFNSTLSKVPGKKQAQAYDTI